MENIKDIMHPNFSFSAIQILWTLTFAALLVLLVVLLGRDRTSRFPWFTGSIVLAALTHLVSRLLFGRLPQLTFAAVSIVLANLSAIVGLVVLIELAHHTFARASRRAWSIGTAVLLIAGGVVLIEWGTWPSAQTLKLANPLAVLGLLQLIAEKAGLLGSVLTIGLGILVVVLGRRFGSGIRTHAQQIMIGLSLVSLAQIAAQATWQYIALHAAPHSLEEYQHVMAIKDRLINGNNAVYAAVVIGWILCLWFDEPGSTQTLAEPAHTEPTVAPQA